MASHLKPIWKWQQFSISEGTRDLMESLDGGTGNSPFARYKRITYKNFGSCSALQTGTSRPSFTGYKLSIFSFSFGARENYSRWKEVNFCPATFPRVDSAFTGVERKHLKCYRSRYNVHCFEEEGHIWVVSWIVSIWHGNGYCECTATTHEWRKMNNPMNTSVWHEVSVIYETYCLFYYNTNTVYSVD